MDELKPPTVQPKRPSMVFQEGLIQKTNTNSLDRAVLTQDSTSQPQDWKSNVLVKVDDTFTTILSDTESEGTVTSKTIKRSMNREEDDDEVVKETSTYPLFDLLTDEDMTKYGLKVGFAEDRNKRFRRSMEDAHSIVVNEDCTFLAIFDGHAGRSAADYASNNIFTHLQTFLKTNNPPEALNLAFEQDLKLKKGTHSGCTAVCAYIHSEERNGVKNRVLYTANVGDARAVLARNGKATRLSYDHKGSDVNEHKRVVEKGGFMMNSRVNGVLAVTRSLGDLSMKEYVLGNPYTTETLLTERDKMLVLACDGVWDVMTDQQVVDLIDHDDWSPQERSDRILDHALDHKSMDNLSVIVCVLGSTNK